MPQDDTDKSSPGSEENESEKKGSQEELTNHTDTNLIRNRTNAANNSPTYVSRKRKLNTSSVNGNETILNGDEESSNSSVSSSSEDEYDEDLVTSDNIGASDIRTKHDEHKKCETSETKQKCTENELGDVNANSVTNSNESISETQHLNAKEETDINSRRSENIATQQQTKTQQSTYQNQVPQQQQPEGWRVKLYRLNADGSWDDCGTGRIVCTYRSTPKTHPSLQSLEEISDIDQWLHQETGEATLCVYAEVNTPSNGNSFNSDAHHENFSKSENQTPDVLLRTRVLLRDAYQRQNGNIITWCEPHYSSNNDTSDNSPDENTNSNLNTGGVDLALSFQDNAGCTDIWNKIEQLRMLAGKLLRHHQQNRYRVSGENSGLGSSSVEDIAAEAAAQHHASLERQKNDLQQKLMFDTNGNGILNNNLIANCEIEQVNSILGGVNQIHSHHHLMLQQQQQQQQLQWQLPNCPTLQNLEDIGDVIARLQHIALHRENLASWIIADDYAYLKQLLNLFPSAEGRHDNGRLSTLATLAACVKTILLLNDSSILDWIVTDSGIFEQVCSCLEYDPDLREKADHRWFLRERVQFRTVVPMEGVDLITLIHRLFRVQYLRDTILRPTMDESSLSTLTSLQTFTQQDIIKSVTFPSNGGIENSEGNSNNSHDATDTLKDSYLVRVIRLLGVEIHAITAIEWNELEISVMSSTTKDEGDVSDRGDDVTSIASSGIKGHNTTKKEERRNGESVVLAEFEPLIDEGIKKERGKSRAWKQYLVSQDDKLESRRFRRHGCISFLRELFNMVRMSLQQGDKDDFFSVICTYEIDLLPSYQDQSVHEIGDNGGPNSTADEYYREISDNVSQTSQNVEVGSVASTVKSSDYRFDSNEKSSKFEQANVTSGHENSGNSLSPTITSNTVAPLPSCALLLSLLGNILADPTADLSDKGFVLEIVVGIANQNASLIRQHSIDNNRVWKGLRQGVGKTESATSTGRPEPNDNKQVIFFCPHDDVLSSLLFLLATESDAGILLQVSEIMRIILDIDMMRDHNGNDPLSPSMAQHGGSIFDDDEAVEGYLYGQSSGSLQQQEQNQQQHANEQKIFFSLFYEYYVEWLIVPFQYTVLYPSRRLPSNVIHNPSESPMMQKYIDDFRKGSVPADDPFLQTVTLSAVRLSYAVELLSFCVRAHYHMKYFLLKSSVLSTVCGILRSNPSSGTNTIPVPGERCLKLSVVRLLRTVISVNDDSYNRHIIQHNLFDSVFDFFRTNPVGDNLVSSAILELCDFIRNNKMKALIEYIVTKHLLPRGDNKKALPNLEDLATPYVSTLTALRLDYDYEASIKESKPFPKIQVNNDDTNHSTTNSTTTRNGEMQAFGHTDHYLPNDDTIHRNLMVLQPPRKLWGKAFEEQRKFRELDAEESYFDSDDEKVVDSFGVST